MHIIYRYRFWLLALLFAVNIACFWPGFIQQDSVGQYQQAITGQYSDHHPPMMSLVWHYLDLVHQGEGLMFGLQLAMLYIAMAVLLLTLDHMLTIKQRTVWCLAPLLLPVYPQVLLYAVNIVKDVQFAFSFLLAASILAYYTIKHSKPPKLVVGVLFLLMLYGAAVKYQGQFCVVVLAVWLGSLLSLRKKIILSLATGVAIYVLLIASINTINNILVPQKSKNYSWEFVKLYDLAAISISMHSDLIPDFNKTASYTFQKLQERFTYPAIDPYIYSTDNILMITRDPQDMSALYKTWANAVFNHPLLYLKHRTINICYALLSRPGYDYALHFLVKLPTNSAIYKIAYIITNAVFYTLMSHLLIVVLGIAYFILALVNWKVSKAAPILLGFTAIALLMVGLLFFMSMAGVPRYTYISIVMVHAAHIFAYQSYVDGKRDFAK